MIFWPVHGFYQPLGEYRKRDVFEGLWGILHDGQKPWARRGVHRRRCCWDETRHLEENLFLECTTKPSLAWRTCEINCPKHEWLVGQRMRHRVHASRLNGTFPEKQPRSICPIEIKVCCTVKVGVIFHSWYRKVLEMKNEFNYQVVFFFDLVLNTFPAVEATQEVARLASSSTSVA